MIDSVLGTGEPVLDNGQGAAERSGKPTASKPQAVDNAPDSNSIQKSPTNTPDGKSVDIKELLAQGQHNNTEGSRDYLAVSVLLGKIKETTERVNTSEAALLGVDKLFEDFETSTQFGLEDIGTVERNMHNQNMDLEIGLFSLTRIMEQARKALRGQVDTDADAAAGANIAEGAANHSLAAGIAEYLAILEEANNEENSGEAQQGDGVLAAVRKHLDAMDKIREEKIATERKKQKDEIFYPEK